MSNQATHIKDKADALTVGLRTETEHKGGLWISLFLNGEPLDKARFYEKLDKLIAEQVA